MIFYATKTQRHEVSQRTAPEFLVPLCDLVSSWQWLWSFSYSLLQVFNSAEIFFTTFALHS